MHLPTEQKFTVGSSFKLAARLFGAKREIQEQDQLSLDGAWLWLHWGPNISSIARCSRRQSLVSRTIHFSHFFITCLSLQTHTLTCACMHTCTCKLALPLPCLTLVKEMASFQGCFLFNWRRADLQCCVNFCYLAKWFTYVYICICIYIYMCVYTHKYIKNIKPF